MTAAPAADRRPRPSAPGNAPSRTARGDRRTPGPLARRQRNMTITAAAVSLLASLPLGTVFAMYTWLIDAIIMVVALCVVGVLVRGVRVPAWVPTAAMILALPVILARQFPSHQELLGVVPTMGTLHHFAALLSSSATEMREYSTPTPDRPGFLFLSTFGVAMTAIMIDLFAVGMRRPAIAGLPMLAIYSVPVAVHEDSVNFLPFAFGVVGFLWLLLSDNIDRVRAFGRRFSGDGRGVDIWEASPLAAAGQRLGIIGIVLAIGVPLAIPGMTTGLFDRFAGGTGAAGGGGGSGSGSGVGLYALLSGSLNRDKAFDMLKVQTNDPNPYYLRMAVAEQLGQSGFRPSTVTGGQPVTDGLPAVAQAPASVGQHTYRASVDIVNLSSPFLPVYQRPTRVERLNRSWLFEQNTSVIYSTKQNTQKKRYSFDFVRSEYSAAALRMAAPVSRGDGLAKDTLSVPQIPAVAALVSRLTTGKQTQYDQVMAIFDYFSPTNGFSYSLRTEEGTSGTQIVDFLTNKHGFCVQYSAAMAWLVRQAGYPSRVAFGFTRGSGQPGTTMTLTNFNLHAWTEVYFAGYGWIPFDATPGSAIAGSVSPGWAPNPSEPNDTGAPTPGASAAAPGAPQASTSAAGRDPLQQDRGSQGGGGGAVTRQARDWPVWTILSLLLLAALLTVPAWRRRVTRRRRLRFHAPAAFGLDLSTAAVDGPVVLGDPSDPSGAARHDAHAAWDELLDTMVDFGIPLLEAETPRVTAARLAGTPLPEAAARGAQALGRAEEYARYARQPVATDHLVGSLTEIRTSLATSANRRTRLRASMFPPSTMRRWRTTFDAFMEQATTTMERRRAAVAKAVSIRRLVRRRA